MTIENYVLSYLRSFAIVLVPPPRTRTRIVTRNRPLRHSSTSTRRKYEYEGEAASYLFRFGPRRIERLRITARHISRRLKAS